MANYDSDYEIRLATLEAMGGDVTKHYDSVYDIDLEILRLTEEGGGSDVIDDSIIALDKTWSSSKINEEIQAVAGTANSDIEGKSTEDFHFVTELPQEAEEDEQVVIKGENADTLYKYISGAWVEQTPDANILYFDVENEALYSYVTAEHQFAPVSMVNTIVVGSNLNSNAALKAIKTPGVYSVVQRLHSSTKGDYIKNWTLTVEGIDYDEYERTDSVYQRIQSNYTIQKRTWSSTRATNDGWSSFSTYYAGEIKDTTTSKYYTWSSNKLSTELADKASKADTSISYTLNQQTQQVEFDFSNLDAFTTDGKYNFVMYLNMFGMNILAGYGTFTVANTFGTVNQYISMTYFKMEYVAFSTAQRIIEEGEETVENVFNFPFLMDNRSSVASTYSSNKINQLLDAKQGTLTAGTGISINNNTISCTVQPTPALEAGENVDITDNKISAIGYQYNGDKHSFCSNISPLPVVSDFKVITKTSAADFGMTDLVLSGAANATTYNLSGNSAATFVQYSSYMIGTGLEISNDRVAYVVSIDSTNNTVTLDGTLDANNAVNEVVLYFDEVAEAEAYISGEANATTYEWYDMSGAFLDILEPYLQKELYINVGDYGYHRVVDVMFNGTIEFETTLDANNAVSDALCFSYKYYDNTATGNYSTANGAAYASGAYSHAEGTYANASGDGSHAEGSASATGTNAHAEGSIYTEDGMIAINKAVTTASGDYSHAEGEGTLAQNYSEHAEGFYNTSHKANTTYGNAGNTQHSIGIGTNKTTRKNAMEVMQNGDAYFYGVGNYDGTTIKAAGNSVKTLKDVLDGKQDTLIAGTGITISGNTISAAGGGKDTSISYSINTQTQTVTFDFTNLDNFTSTGYYTFDMYLNMFGMNVLAGYGEMTVVDNGDNTMTQTISMIYNKMEYTAISTAVRMLEVGETPVNMVVNIPFINDSRGTALSTYSGSKIDDLISALDTRITALGG